MRKKFTFFILALFTPLFLFAENLQKPEVEKVTIPESNFLAVAKVAQERYVRLQTESVRNPKSGASHASAVRVGCKLLLSNFHVLAADSVTTEPGPGKKMVEVTIRALNPPTDMLALESVTPAENLSVVKFAEKVEVGELLVNYSNANGSDGFLKSYRVARVDDTIHFLLDRPALPGESGSGLFNMNGELVGIVDASIQSGSDRLYGTAITAKVLKAFTEIVSVGSPELNACTKK